MNIIGSRTSILQNADSNNWTEVPTKLDVLDAIELDIILTTHDVALNCDRGSQMGLFCQFTSR